MEVASFTLKLHIFFLDHRGIASKTISGGGQNTTPHSTHTVYTEKGEL